MRLTVLLLALWTVLGAKGEDAEKLFAGGVEAYAAEEYQRAMDLLEKAIEARPDVSKYHHWFGRAVGRRAEQVFFTRAIGLAKKVGASFERAVQLDPANVQALNDLLDFYLQAPGIVGGGADKAPAIAARLAKINPAEGHRAAAQILIKRKDYAGAEKELRLALALEPNKAGRVLELASFLADRGRHAEAEALFDRAAQLAPDSPEYLFSKGKYLAVSKKNPEAARQLLERYLESPRKPDDPPPSEVEELIKKL